MTAGNVQKLIRGIQAILGDLMMSVDPTAKIYERVRFLGEAVISEFAIVGKPSRPSLGNLKTEPEELETIIGDKVYVGPYSMIEAGATIGAGTLIEDRTTVEEKVTIGTGCIVGRGGRIEASAIIDNSSVIRGFVAERSKIGKDCRVFGMLLHAYRQPGVPWDEQVEQAPVVDNFAVIAFGSLVIGNVRIGANAYVASGAIVTKNVPKNHIATGTNNFTPIAKWSGRLGFNLAKTKKA